MPASPHSIYQQSIDKQRIMITGQGSTVIAAIIRHVLNLCNRKFDFVDNSRLDHTKLTDAPVLIIDSGISLELLEYKHHIGVLSHFSLSDGTKAIVSRLADATPKSGILVYAELDPAIKAIATRERADVQVIPFKACPHEVVNGQTMLVSSSNEKFPVSFSGDINLQYVSAAKAVLKKIGITSGQFYHALTSFQLN